MHKCRLLKFEEIIGIWSCLFHLQGKYTLTGVATSYGSSIVGERVGSGVQNNIEHLRQP